MRNKYVFVVVLLAVILAAGAGLTAFSVHLRNRTEARSGDAESAAEASAAADAEASAAADATAGAAGSAAGSAEEFTVVTSFYPMYIAAENVIGGCEGVRLENLSEPQTGCLHDYQLTTEDMKLLSTADVFVINGGGIETFLARVAEQYPDLTVIDACEGIELLGDNAHAWMSVEDYMVQVQNICDGLCAAAADEWEASGASSEDSGTSAADPDIVDTFRGNTDVYLGKLGELEEECTALADEIAGEPVVLFHEAYEYLAEELGLIVVGEMDMDEERQVSAGEVAQIISVIESEQVPVIFAEELYAKDMGDRMEEETDVTVLYLDPLTRGIYDADSYLDGMRENLRLIYSAYQ